MRRIIWRREEDNLTIDDAFREFILEKKAEGLSTKTIIDYEEAFSCFCKDLDLSSEQKIRDINEIVINQWIVDILQVKYKRLATVNHRIRHIKAWLNYCFKKEYLSKFEIHLLKGQEERLKYYSDKDIEKLLRRPSQRCGFVEYRNWVTACFILATGARASTICNIKIEDIDWDKKNITFTILKNKKIAVIPISLELERILKEYLKKWKRTDYKWLFCSISEQQLLTNGLREGFNKFCKSRGVEPKGLHALRHSFARGFILNNGNAFFLQRMLTHSTLEMTKKYIRIYDEDLHINLEEYSPLDNAIKKKTRHKTISKM